MMKNFNNYAKVDGTCGFVLLADTSERMTLNESINAKSYNQGVPTKYNRIRDGYSCLVTGYFKFGRYYVLYKSLVCLRYAIDIPMN